MSVSAKEVNKLRQLTGAGMMDCKKALTESAGNVEKAIELLRKQGQRLSQTRASRVANEGCIVIRLTDSKQDGVLLALSCETDFVAKNESFLELGKIIADLALAQRPVDIDALLALSHEGLSLTERINELITKIGEKITVSNYTRLQGDYLVGYLHAGAKLGVLVAFSGAEADIYEKTGKNVAMQIAAMSPLALDKDSIPADVIQKELEIGREIARKAGKPDQLLERIAQGRLQKFFKEQTLLEQDFVKDSALSVAKYLASVSPTLKITAFLRLTTAG